MRRIMWSAVTLGFLLIVGATARAQLNPRYGRPSPIERDSRYRDWVLDQLRHQRRKLTEKELQLAYEQIQQDFERIQVINNELLREAAMPDGELNYRIIAKEVAEMEKRAARLKDNLFLPEESNDKRSRKEYDDLQIKTLLSWLDTQVVSFVKNPMFKSTEVIDTRLAARARRELDTIILFSDKIRKRAERAAKN